MNAFGKGDVGFTLVGVPVRALFDVGTDMPLRGQRNSIRLTLDKEQLHHGQQVKDAVRLARQKAILDSLNALKSAHYCEWRGAEFRIEELKAVLLAMERSRLPDTSSVDLPATPRFVLDVPQALQQSCMDHAHLGSAWPSGPDTPNFPQLPSEDHARLDSLQHAADAHDAEVRRLEAAIADAEQDMRRYEALFNSTKGAHGKLAGWLNGIDHLDIGTCSPASSEFLINGITFQGVSFAYVQHDLYLSFDRGRSFDDAWLVSDRIRSQLEALQRSLFFSDAKDLAPRHITAIRAGFGAPERTHFHVGYLFGERADLPLGYSGPSLDPGTTRNHVVEVDMGFEARPGHTLRAVLARSLTLPGSIGSDEEQGTIGDLFRRGNDRNMAAKLIWSSRFERSGMTVDLEGRSIAPYFQSMGSGFLRNGSRVVEVRASRAMGRKWKVRGRYALEDRQQPGGEQAQMRIQRAQLQLSYRASRHITLRAMGMPMALHTILQGMPVITSRNTSTSIGGDVQQRWKDVTTTLTCDVNRYDWHSDEGASGAALNWAVGAMLQFRDGWQGRVIWNTLVASGDGSSPGASNVSAWLRYRSDGWEMEGGLQAPTGLPWGWSAGAQRSITDKLSAAVRVTTYSRSDLLFQESYQSDPEHAYNWSCSLIYSW
ncbi:MAG: hypothetical protein QM724_13415 [Flavobacteriales bacterium]